MSKDPMMQIGAGAAVVVLGYLLWKKFMPATSAPAVVAGATTQAVPVPTSAAAGWQYYTDGTAISPDGSYYQNGVQIWNSAAP